MKVELMRSEIANVYPSTKWRTRVRKMPEAQVIAIYHSFLKNDIFSLKEKQKKEQLEYKQLTFDDVFFGWDEANGDDYSTLIVQKVMR